MLKNSNVNQLTLKNAQHELTHVKNAKKDSNTLDIIKGMSNFKREEQFPKYNSNLPYNTSWGWHLI